MSATPVTFYFDPACPWAWMASRWMLEVESVRDVAVTWRQMSLWALNEDRDLPPQYRDMMTEILPMSRVLAQAITDHGDEVALPLYNALGERIHRQQRQDYDAITAEALAEVGLSEDLLAAGSKDALDQDLRARRDAVIELVGPDVGTPTIEVEGSAFFGPVVTPAPTGEAAGRLFDGCVLVAGTDGFFELKRTRDRDPIID